MKIIHSVACLKTHAGGLSRCVKSLCDVLIKHGENVQIIAQDYRVPNHPNIELTSSENILFVPGLYVPKINIVYSLGFAQKLNDICRSSSVHLIHDNGLWLHTNHAAARIAKLSGIPLIVQPHGMLEPNALTYRSSQKKLVWKLFQRRDAESAALLIATSMQEADSLRQAGLHQPIAIIPNGVDIPEWKEKPIDEMRVHTALFLSRIHPIKGLLNLVKAWDIVRPKGWQVIIAGPDEGGHQAVVTSAIRNTGLERQISMVGAVSGSDREKLYRDADLFILPTFSENFGMVVAEALSYGVPVITTKGAPWEGLVGNRCGWWVDIGAEALAEALRQAVQISDAERQEMGLRGRRYVESQFSWPRVADDMIAAYRWILGLGDMPGFVELG